MDVKALARALGITQQAVSRAQELLRLLKLKAPGSLGQGEICRPSVCLELACQTTPGSSLPLRDQFIRHSCCAPKVYNETFTKIQRLLDVRPALDLQELVTVFGCTQLQHSVQDLLRKYKTRFLEKLDTDGRGKADFSRPSFLAAAFVLTAKRHRVKVDRALLHAKMGITRQELASCLEDMEALCGDLLAGAKHTAQDAEGRDSAGRGDSKGVRGGAASNKRSASAAAADSEDEQAGPSGAPRGHGQDVAVEDLMLVLTGRVRAAPKAALPAKRQRKEEPCPSGMDSGGEGEVQGDQEAAVRRKASAKGHNAGSERLQNEAPAAAVELQGRPKRQQRAV